MSLRGYDVRKRRTDSALRCRVVYGITVRFTVGSYPTLGPFCHRVLNLFHDPPNTLHTDRPYISSSTWAQAAPACSGSTSPYSVIVRYMPTGGHADGRALQAWAVTLPFPLLCGFAPYVYTRAARRLCERPLSLGVNIGAPLPTLPCDRRRLIPTFTHLAASCPSPDTQPSTPHFFSTVMTFAQSLSVSFGSETIVGQFRF